MVNTATICGALLPDLSLYFMVFWNRNIRGMDFDQIFGVEYFSSFWQQVFAVDNSIPLWSLLLIAGAWRRSPVLIAFAGAGLLHLALDFPLHHDDGRVHFWPLSNWIFESPVSYWDPRHFGGILGPIEALLCLILLVLLWRRFEGPLARGAILLAGILEAIPAFVFPLVLGSPEA